MNVTHTHIYVCHPHIHIHKIYDSYNKKNLVNIKVTFAYFA